MKLIYLPLDSRPCNFDWPSQLLENTGHTLIKPEFGCMDYFKQTSSFEDRKCFLLENVADADALILSVDQLCYGSLLASRSPETSLDAARERLLLVSEIKRAHPKIRIHAYSVIMRASISALCRGDLAAYENMSNYSLFSGKVQDALEVDDAEQARVYQRKADEIAAALAPGLLEAYHFVRQRNYEINSDCVRLAGDNTFDSLLLLQEDAPEYGFHKAEQKALLKLKSQLNAHNVWLHNGADEGACNRYSPNKSQCYPVQVQTRFYRAV